MTLEAPEAVAPDPAIATPAPETTAPAPETTAAPEAALAPNDMLSVVQAALKAPEPDNSEPEKANSEPDPAKSDPVDAAAPAIEEADPTDEQIAALDKPAVRKWVQRSLRKAHEATQQFEAARPDAEAWQAHTGWLQQQQITPDEAQKTYQVMAALKSGDYAGFLALTKPYLEHAQLAVGDRLPPDIQAAVDDGQITAEYAREITRARSDATTQAARADRVTQQTADSQHVQHMDSLKSAVNSFEGTLRAKDADYDAVIGEVGGKPFTKAQAVKDNFIAIISQRPPRTAADARAMAEEAYQKVNAVFVRARPAPTATRPSASASASATAAHPVPKSFADAVALGLRQSAR